MNAYWHPLRQADPFKGRADIGQQFEPCTAILLGNAPPKAVDRPLNRLVGGCINLGPDYQRPEAKVESDWLEIEAQLVTSEPATDPKWWKTAFQDPELDKLVEAALQQNLTLRSAGLRVLQSQQQLAIAIGNQYPQQQQATGSASRQKENDIIFNNYNLGLNLG